MMADLKQALLWLAEGKKIRGKDWQNGVYLVLNDDFIVDEDGDEASPDLEGDDWEIYDEEVDHLYLALVELSVHEMIEGVDNGITRCLHQIIEHLKTIPNS